VGSRCLDDVVWSVSDGLRMITSGVGGARYGDPGPSANYVARCVCVAPCPATYKLKVELPIPHTRPCRCNTPSDYVAKYVDVGNSFVNHIFSKQISGGVWCMLLVPHHAHVDDCSTPLQPPRGAAGSASS
jgi:hypothetical protein